MPVSSGSEGLIRPQGSVNIGRTGSSASNLTIDHPVIYHIPGTQSVLYVDLQHGLHIPRDLLISTLHEAILEVWREIRTYGEGPIHREPFAFHPYSRCFIYAQSNPELDAHGRKRHLTWIVLHSALTGLYHSLVLRMNYVAAVWRVSDGDLGIVGLGTISTPLAVSGDRMIE